jgi:nucleotide-binding universal stress UspA family protein
VERGYPVMLLASDGSAAMPAAITMAHLIATRTPSDVHVVTAVEPMPSVTPEGNLPYTPEVDELRRDGLEARVLEQLTEFAPESSRWEARLVDGRPDETIVRTAHDAGAALIVLGLGEHGMVERWFGGETALRVLRISDVPVLAVAPTARTLPRRVLVATDFSQPSMRALRSAIPLMAPDATITLVHVVPRDISMGVWPAWDDAYERAVKASFDELRAGLDLPATMTLDERILCGEPARAILEEAEREHADLIVAGTHGHNAVAHALLGRTSTKLLRGARCSVFVHPPERRAR